MSSSDRDLFLLTIETSSSERSLRTIHICEYLAHVVDMHQLTRDRAPPGPMRQTPVFSEGTMSPGQLGRYLDYCSELLSVTATRCALCASPTKSFPGCGERDRDLTTGLRESLAEDKTDQRPRCPIRPCPIRHVPIRRFGTGQSSLGPGVIQHEIGGGGNEPSLLVRMIPGGPRHQGAPPELAAEFGRAFSGRSAGGGASSILWGRFIPPG